MSFVPRFVGAIPEIYERHLGPVLFEPYARDLAARVPTEASAILEIAAGTGRVTRHLLASLPAAGALVATDLNEPMLVEAERRIPADRRLRFQVADAQALPFSGGAFDAVVCQFGLMFVPDKPLAIREIRRVLRPGGTLLLSVWDDVVRNHATRALQELAFAELPSDPPNFMLTPFSMHDADALHALVASGGFTAIQVETVAQTAVSPSAAELALGFVRGNPLWNQLVERAIDADAFQARVEARLRADFGDAPCTSPLSAHVVTARA